jgi:hypothetical protein
MFLAMSCLDDLIYDMINPKMQQYSPIFKKYNFMKDRNYQVKKIGDWVCVPLDQKGFERQTSFAMLKAVLRVIRKRLSPDDEESIEVLALIEKKMLNAKLLFKHEGKVYINMEDITNGLSSGWKWTALFNTLINLGEFLTCASGLGWRVGVDYTNLCALGDDTRVWVRSFQHASKMLDWYEAAKIEINRKVAIVSKTCDEFLRKVTQRHKDGTSSFRGYANRMCAAICYRNPKSTDPASLLPALETAAQNWLDLASRCSERESSDNILNTAMCDDLVKICLAYGLKMPDSNFVHTSVIEGGLGVTPLVSGTTVPLQNMLVSNPSVKFNKRMLEILQTTINKYHLPQEYRKVDRDFHDSFLSESVNRKVHSYEVSRVKKMYLGKMSARAENKLRVFSDELFALIEDSPVINFDLPLKKSDYIPKSEFIGSGFFRSIYEATPLLQRRDLFTRPEVYDRLRMRLGPALCDQIVMKGIQWVNFRTWKYSTDFYNSLAAQYFMYWIEHNLASECSIDSLQVLTNQLLDDALSHTKWFITN